MSAQTKSDIDLLLERSAELEAKATKGPWKPVSDLPMYAVWADAAGPQGLGGDVVCSKSRNYASPNVYHYGSKQQDAEFIAHTRNTSILKDQMIRTLSEALEKITRTCFQPDHRDGIKGTHWDMTQAAREALTEASRLAREVMEKCK